jgi:hypothetical protein
VIFRAIDGVGYADREVLAGLLHLSEKTIRRHCKPAMHDPATGRALYEHELAMQTLESIKARRARRLPLDA